jgi:hypothetical protein
MNEKDLAELLKYSSSKEIYIIDKNNKLKRLHCPFKVKTLHSIHNLKKGQIVLVEEVKVNLKFITIYIISARAYYFYYFDIIGS